MAAWLRRTKKWRLATKDKAYLAAKINLWQWNSFLSHTIVMSVKSEIFRASLKSLLREDGGLRKSSEDPSIEL